MARVVPLQAIRVPPIEELPPHLDPDFHESEDCAHVMRLLGLICVDWNMCEHYFSTLLWHYIGGYEVGQFVTAPMGNQTRADVLLALAKRAEKGRKLLGAIEFAAKAFNRLREIRNILLHSHSIMLHSSHGKLVFSRDSSRGGRLQVHVTPKHLMEIYEAIGNMAFYMTGLYIYYSLRVKGKKRSPLPEIFPLPDISTLPRRAKRKTSQRRPRPSSGSQPHAKKPRL